MRGVKLRVAHACGDEELRDGGLDLSRAHAAELAVGVTSIVLGEAPDGTNLCVVGWVGERSASVRAGASLKSEWGGWARVG